MPKLRGCALMCEIPSSLSCARKARLPSQTNGSSPQRTLREKRERFIFARLHEIRACHYEKVKVPEIRTPAACARPPATNLSVALSNLATSVEPAAPLELG